MRLRRAVSIVALLVVPVFAFGQGFQGGLRGAVRDAAGAVVPGVEIMLVNEATNLTRATLSNEADEYSFPALEPGSYKLHGALPGFKTLDLEGVRIGTQQFVTLDLKTRSGRGE